MNLVIAEKDELGRDIARALCGKDVPAGARLPVRGNGWTVCAASGHLLELAEPGDLQERWKRWDVEELPIAPYPWPKVAAGERAAARLETIAEELRRCDGSVYCAGDADDEGQLIVDEVLEHLGYDPRDDRMMRVYVNDNIPKNIRAAFDAAVPNASCVAAGKAALARQLADASFGFSESRLATKRLDALVALGRVQTPTLGLVIERDLARERHEKREFYVVRATVESDDGPLAFSYRPEPGALEDGKHLFDRAVAERAARAAEGARCAFDLKVKESEEQPPLPFNMTSLAAEMSRRCKMSAMETLEATQSLRDAHKAITYNRSPSSYLKDEHFEQAPAVAAVAARNISCGWPIDTSVRSRAFDGSKVTSHHGIIPQETELDLSGMTDHERETYRAVAERYLAQFLPPARVVESEAAFEVEGCPGSFKHAARRIADPGWRAHLKAGAEGAGPDEPAPAGSLPREGRREGRVASVEAEAKLTSPPQAFTDGSLMTAMANIAKYVRDAEVKAVLLKKDEGSPDEHGSIGTSATRAAIIEGLVEHGYLEREGSKLLSTPKARALWSLVPDEIKGVDLTARWWLMQQQVASGELRPDAIMADVAREFEAHRETAYEGKTLAPSVGPCPRCGSPVVMRGSAYSCSSNVEREVDGSYEHVAGCGFKILPFCGMRLSPAQAKAVIEGKAIPVEGLVSKRTGRSFDCRIALDASAAGGVRPLFDDPKPKGGRSPKGGRPGGRRRP